jgi:hemerythrin-like domain-containing protein
MLTATYTLVTLSVEQASVRLSLQSLQKMLQSTFLPQAALTPGQVDYACNALQQLYDICHWRKIEKYVIPAISRTTREADQLLLDLDQLSLAAASAMSAATDRLGVMTIDSEERVAQFCAAIDAFCSSLLKRLEREEQELFPVARTVISGEAWFSIANQMLAHDAYQQENRSSRQPILLGAPERKRIRRDRARQQALSASLAH